MAEAPVPEPDAEHEHDSVLVICCTHVLNNTAPILRVSHDADDGDWQMHCAVQEHDATDARVVCFQCMLLRDATLKELADLPIGWGADRESPQGSWARSVNPAPSDDG